MKTFIGFTLALLMPWTCAAGGDLGRSFGVAVRAGTVFSTGGNWTTEAAMRDVVKAGPDFNLALEKWVGDHFASELEMKLAWMHFKEGALPGAAGHPSFTVPALLFSNRYHFTTNRLRPFLSAGAGMYFWRINTDGVLHSVLQREGERIEKLSYGLHIGGGGELILSNRASIMVEARYHYILSQDRFIFGNGFTDQGVLTAALGASVYLAAP